MAALARKAPSPFDDYDAWTLAGSSADGVVYAVSVDPISLDVNLWNYNDAQRRWKRLATSDYASAPQAPDHHCLMSAAYNENSARVDVFLESNHSSAYIFRFITTPVPKLIAVLSAVSDHDDDIHFDGTTGPSLQWVGNDLVLTGAKLSEHGWRLGVYQVVINHDQNTFSLKAVWLSNPSYFFLNRVVVVSGNRLVIIAMAIDLEAIVYCITPAETVTPSTVQWADATVAIYRIRPFIRDMFALCPSMNAPDAVWIVPRYSEISEAIVQSDASVVSRRTFKRGSLGEVEVVKRRDGDNPRQGAAASSASHVFCVIDNDDDELEIVSEVVGVPTLQFLCLSSLCSTNEEIKQCKSEKHARKLGIPILAWRRFCR